MQPSPAVIDAYAEHIMTIIDDDTAARLVPARVRAFADLHDYLHAAGVPKACTPAARTVTGQVQNDVTRRLLAP